MIIRVKAFPNSKTEEIIKKGNDRLVIYIKEKAKNNDANFRIFKLLTTYFKIPQNHIRIISGTKRSNKIFEIIKEENGTLSK